MKVHRFIACDGIRTIDVQSKPGGVGLFIGNGMSSVEMVLTRSTARRLAKRIEGVAATEIGHKR